MKVRKAILKGFNSTDYTAVLQLTESSKIYLEGITVARNIPSAEMIIERQVIVCFSDEYNSKDALVTAVFEQG